MWKRWLRIPLGPVFWILVVQSAWTVTLVLWIVYFVDRRSRLPHEGWGVMVAGILLLACMNGGVTVIVVHFGRQVTHNRAMKDFVSQVSHDLRSPLATVKLHLETLHLRNLTPEQREDCLGMALQELGRLEGGIEGILTASRIDRQGLRIATETMDLKGFLLAYATAKEKEVGVQGGFLELSVEHAPAAMVRGDPILLRQMLDNLVDNAVAHCQPGVHVRVEVGEQGGCAVVGVADNGPGLESVELKRVFRMFYRSPRSKRHSKGTGLGLFIVAGIAKAHGGRAWVDSQGLGRGCHFRVALPLVHAKGVPS